MINNNTKVKSQVQFKSCSSHKENCSQCMKGGFPLRKEILSFLVLFLIAGITVLGVLLINEKRELFYISQNVKSQNVKSQKVVQPKIKKYELPVAKLIKKRVSLPVPKTTGEISVEEAIKIRRSKRSYSTKPVLLSELGQVLWAAQGLTDDKGHRAAPSARGVYPYSLYVVVRNVKDLSPGLYLYDPTTHSLGDLGLDNAGDLLTSAGVQDTSKKAPVVIVMAASYGKAAEKFPDNPEKITLLEGGHIGQNIYLEVEALKMATVVTAGFDSSKVVNALGLDINESIIYLVPFGHIGEKNSIKK